MWAAKTRITKNLFYENFFKACKKLIKNILVLSFLYIFFPIYKNISWILWKKNQRKSSNKGSQKVSTSFWRREKNKKCQCTCKQYRNLSKDEENKNQQNGRERYENLAEDEKQKLVVFRKNYSKMQKNKD